MSKNKYQTHVEPKLKLIKGWARDGLSEEQIATNLKVAYSTFRDYKKKYSALSTALKENKETADYAVKNSLFEQCLGRTVKEQKAYKVKEVYYDDAGRKCESEKVVVVDVMTYIKPDTLAMAIWLNNRLPEEFKKNANKETLDQLKFEYEKEKDKKKDW